MANKYEEIKKITKTRYFVFIIFYMNFFFQTRDENRREMSDRYDR